MQAFCFLSGKSFIDVMIEQSLGIHNGRQRLIDGAIHGG